jgi:hypothetical protein
MRKSGVKIMVLDRASKKELEVQPRQFTGRLLHEFGTLAVAFGDIEVEVYLNAPGPDNQVGLYKAGTRVVSSLPEMDAFNLPPWSSGYLQGMIDAPFIQLTPGTRTGVVHDERFDMLVQALEGISGRLNQIIELEKAAEDEQTSRNILKSVQKAFKEAFLSLPPEDYRWFDLYSGSRKTDLQKGRAGAEGASGGAAEGEPGVPAGGDESGEGDVKEREFFHYPGPLYSAVISPASAVVKVDSARGLRCIPRDKSRRMIEENVSITWAIKKGGGSLSAQSGEVVTFTAPNEPGLTVIEAEAS